MRSSGINDEWISQVYASDVHSHLLKRELKCMEYTMRSPQLKYRESIIEYIDTVCEMMHFCKQVKHLALYLVDLLMDNFTVHTKHLQLVVLGCLIVAVKVDEMEYLIPKMSAFNHLVGDIYNLKDFVRMEMTIMEFFKWDLLIPTVAIFADYYSLHAVSDTDYYADIPLCRIKSAKEHCLQYIEFFLNLTLQDVSFHKFRASLVAASCVASARICLVITPTWPRHLRDITSYELDDLKCSLKLLTKLLGEVKSSPVKISDLLNDSSVSPFYGCPENSDMSSCSSTPGSCGSVLR